MVVKQQSLLRRVGWLSGWMIVGIWMLAPPAVWSKSSEANFTPSSKRAQGDEYIHVKMRGRLNAQVFAIGGETTGVVISARGATWELDFGEDKALREKATELHEQEVLVEGELNVKKGVEIRQRWIVTVKSLVAADSGPAPPVPSGDKLLDEQGQLIHRLVLRDAQNGFAGESGSVWTINRDGSWKHQTFLNANLRPPEGTGQLTADQLANLAASLARHDFASLPQRLGKEPGVNPHVVTLRFGEQESAFVLKAGEAIPIPAVEKVKSHEDRFGRILGDIRALMDESPDK